MPSKSNDHRLLYQTDVSGLVKDPDTNAVLSSDTERLRAYKLAKIEKQRLSKLEKRVDTLEKLVSELMTKYARI